MTRRDLGILLQGLIPVFRVIAQRFAALEVKERGLDGKVGERGPQGIPGRDGLPGVPGLQGDKGSNGTPGLNGTNGRDGTLEQLKTTWDGERTITLCFKNGDPIEGGVIKLVGLRIHRGVYQPGKFYECGDEVTRAGATWFAKQDTTNPPDPNGDWTLSAQRGREGKQGQKGEKGIDGIDGRHGRDLTQMGTRGEKW